MLFSNGPNNVRKSLGKLDTKCLSPVIILIALFTPCKGTVPGRSLHEMFCHCGCPWEFVYAYMAVYPQVCHYQYRALLMLKALLPPELLMLTSPHPHYSFRTTPTTATTDVIPNELRRFHSALRGRFSLSYNGIRSISITGCSDRFVCRRQVAAQARGIV